MNGWDFLDRIQEHERRLEFAYTEESTEFISSYCNGIQIEYTLVANLTCPSGNLIVTANRTDGKIKVTRVSIEMECYELTLSQSKHPSIWRLAEDVANERIK